MWSVVSTKPLFIFHFSESSVHEYESSLRLGYCGIRGGVRFRLPAFHGGGFTYRACSSWDVLCPIAFLVALGVAFGSTLPVKRALGYWSVRRWGDSRLCDSLCGRLCVEVGGIVVCVTAYVATIGVSGWSSV